MHSHHMHNEHKTVENLISRLKREKPLISDAGTPAISDPGFFVDTRCVENGITVECFAQRNRICARLSKQRTS
jgi:16S rRNA (cytidine1402-2'-O)-methyltransferase